MLGTFDISQVQAALGLRYGNIRKIGAGGMASVYSAHDSVLARSVAVKLVSSQHAIEELAMRFQQEAKLASRLHHPNIVTVLDFGRGANGVLYLVMDLVEGSSLSQVIKETGPLSLNEALRVLIQICDGLAHAHRQGVMHRDLKPGNVMIGTNSNHESEVRIVDFGLAKVVSGDQKITKTGAMLGTPLYASPEQLQGKPVDHRTDIYSFGCLMFETLIGKPPFKSSNQFEIYEMHLNSEVPKLAERGYTGERTEDLDRIIKTAMAKDRNDRYETFSQLKSELVALLPEESRVEWNTQEEKYAINRFRASSFFSQHKLPITLATGAVAVLTSVLMINESKEMKTAPVPVPETDGKIGFDENEWAFVPHTKNGVTTWTNCDCRMSDKHFKMLQGKNVRSVMLYTMRLNGSGLHYLKGEPLERLVLPESKIVDEHLHLIGEFKLLKELDLSYSWIHDSGLATIAELPKLNNLAIAGCRALTEASVDSMIKFAPNISRLNLSYTPVGKKGFEKLKSFEKLEDLDLSLSDLTDDMLEPIFALDLRCLTLSKNKDLTDKSIYKLTRMKRLADLRIDGCPKITDDAIAAIKRTHPGIHLVTAAKKRDESMTSDILKDLMQNTACDTKSGAEPARDNPASDKPPTEKSTKP
jgi:hypothetical protein